jgi:ZIP family zinc transporter
MSFAGTAALGAVAGFTIFLGLPIGRLRHPRPTLMAFLNAAAIGVLLFLFYDVLKNAGATVTSALDDNRSTGIGYALLVALGLAIGLLGLVAFERMVLRKQKRPGPGAMAATAVVGDTSAAVRREPLAPAFRISLFIAVGIGLHNFSEGLAIGGSAHAGSYQLLYVLVIGFGLHNATEGFGVTAPLLGQSPSWRFLALGGLIAGGPTLLGTLIGYQFTNDALSVLFLALAAGAIVYVVGELQHVGRKIGSHDVAMVGLLVGFLAGFGTDLLLHSAGA